MTIIHLCTEATANRNFIGAVHQQNSWHMALTRENLSTDCMLIPTQNCSPHKALCNAWTPWKVCVMCVTSMLWLTLYSLLNLTISQDMVGDENPTQPWTRVTPHLRLAVFCNERTSWESWRYIMSKWQKHISVATRLCYRIQGRTCFCIWLGSWLSASLMHASSFPWCKLYVSVHPLLREVSVERRRDRQCAAGAKERGGIMLLPE